MVLRVVNIRFIIHNIHEIFKYVFFGVPSVGTSITNPSIYLAGASGGVYALITAHIATIIMVSMG